MELDDTPLSHISLVASLALTSSPVPLKRTILLENLANIERELPRNVYAPMEDSRDFSDLVGFYVTSSSGPPSPTIPSPTEFLLLPPLMLLLLVFLLVCLLLLWVIQITKDKIMFIFIRILLRK